MFGSFKLSFKICCPISGTTQFRKSFLLSTPVYFDKSKPTYIIRAILCHFRQCRVYRKLFQKPPHIHIHSRELPLITSNQSQSALWLKLILKIAFLDYILYVLFLSFYLSMRADNNFAFLFSHDFLPSSLKWAEIFSSSFGFFFFIVFQFFLPHQTSICRIQDAAKFYLNS